MSHSKKRPPLPGPEYRYDAYGRVVKRKRAPYGPKHSELQGRGEDFSGNREAFIYWDIPREGNYSKIITTEHVRKVQTLADASGNPRVWTSDECSQEFLRSLISDRRGDV